MNCLNCNTSTNNPKFCSQSCAATYNNKLSPKKFKTKKCKTCNNLILSDYTYCESCFKEKSILNKQIGSYANLGPNRYRSIRDHAKSVMKNIPKVCIICGYDKHAEIHHKKSISSYPKTTLVSEVNSKDNLIYLCPNHHWEYENGLSRI